jgi:hypothetical protein
MIKTFALLLAYLSSSTGQLLEVRVSEGLSFEQCRVQAQERTDELRQDAKGLRVYAACVPMPSARFEGKPL